MVGGLAKVYTIVVFVILHSVFIQWFCAHAQLAVALPRVTNMVFVN